MYGPQCQQECLCENGAECDHVSGACTCSDGWRSTFCDKRELSLTPSAKQLAQGERGFTRKLLLYSKAISEQEELEGAI